MSPNGSPPLRAAGRRQIRRNKPASGPGPDVRRRPRARSAGKAGAECHHDGLCGDQAAGTRDGQAKMRPSAIGQARSDDSGRFQIDAPRTASSRNHLIGAVALAPGYGAGWVELDPDVDRPDVDITLRPEQVIQGRLFDLNGRPVQGVTVMVQTMGRLVPADLANHRQESIDGPSFWWNTSEASASLAHAGGERCRRPIHHPRRGPRPPGYPHH